MDLFVPITLGFLSNLAVFILSKLFKLKGLRSLANCFLAFLAVLIGSFFVGAWTGMGLAVISAGMLLFVVLTAIVLSLRPGKA